MDGGSARKHLIRHQGCIFLQICIIADFSPEVPFLLIHCVLLYVKVSLKKKNATEKKYRLTKKYNLGRAPCFKQVARQ